MQFVKMTQEFELGLVSRYGFRCSYRSSELIEKSFALLTALEGASDSGTKSENHIENSDIVL